MKRDAKKDWLMLQYLIRGLTDEYNLKHLGYSYDNLYPRWLTEEGISKDKEKAICDIIHEFSLLIGYYDIKDEDGDDIDFDYKEDIENE